MRLIDADALIHELNNSHYPGAPYVDAGISIAIGKICDAPTIEERNKGRWIHDGYDHPHGVDWCHCSICGNRESVDSVYTQVDIYPYCAKCGAIMMEVEHDNL